MQQSGRYRWGLEEEERQENRKVELKRKWGVLAQPPYSL